MTPGQAKKAVYFTLTVDYGDRDSELQADNLLDFDGFLHVDDVPAFIRALETWRDAVLRTSGTREGRRQPRAGIVEFLEGRCT